MKKIIAIILSACGSDMVIKGKEWKTIGLVNILVNDSSIMEQKNPDVGY